MNRLSPERRELLVNAFLGTIVVLLGLWVFLAVIIGSAAMATWLEART